MSVAVVSKAVEIKKDEQKPPLKPELGTSWHWEPSEAFLTEQDLFKKTSYAVSLVYIFAKRGTDSQILLVRQNPEDPEKFAQLKGGARTRTDEWKTPIGRFYPFRYIDEKGKGLLDQHLLDTAIEEVWEESGIDFADLGEEILRSLKNAPVAEYCKMSDRPGSVYHIDRVHFWVTPYFFKPDKKIWSKQKELTRTCLFSLFELPRKHINGWGEDDPENPRDPNNVGADMMYSHTRRLVEFLEHPNSAKIRWQSGIPDNAGAQIRSRFPDYRIP